MELNHQINELEKIIYQKDLENISVSSKGVYWHLDHILQVIVGIVNVLGDSNPANYKSNISIKGQIVFLIKRMPRGVGKAPKRVTAKGEIEREHLENRLRRAKAALDQIEGIKKGHYYAHAIFGNLKKKKALKFIEIHTQHHLKIIYDIKKNKA